MIEFNPFHGECLPGIAKYFIDLGFHIDVLLNPIEFNNAPFSDFKKSDINIFKMSANTISYVLTSDIMKQYSHVYINSDLCYTNSNLKLHSMLNSNKLKFPRGKIITLCHGMNRYASYNFNHIFKGITLADFPVIQNFEYKSINPHYFGDFIPKERKKENFTNFICVGNIQSKRKNHTILIDAVRKLIENNIKNFKITIVARNGELIIPEDISEYFDFKGQLDYHHMYKEINNSDFYLPLLDPENKDHERYISIGSSGSYQLIYGFCKPCIICEKFMTNINKFTRNNSISYKTNNDLYDAMQKAIRMNAQDYDKLKNELKETAQHIYEKSLNNLKYILSKNT